MGLYSDINFNNGQYIQQYAGAPIEEIQQTSDVLAARHYGNIAAASNLEILANQLKSEMLPGAKANVDTHIAGLDKALQDMAKSGGENSTARITALANALKGDQGILNAGLRSKEYKKQTELIDTLTAQGHIPVYDKRRRQALEQAGVSDPVYNTPYAAGVQPYLSPVKDWEDLLTKVQPDKWLVQGLSPDKANNIAVLKQALASGEIDMPLFLTEVQRLGVSKQKLQGFKDELLASYKNMPSYSQQINKDLGEGFGKSDQQIQNELMRYAMLYQFQRDDTGFHAIPRGLGGRGGNTPQPYPTQAPAQTAETLFDYNANGYTTDYKYDVEPRTYLNTPGQQEELLKDVKGKTGTGSATERQYSPQYIKDYKTMAEITGADPNVAPGSKEAKQLAADYKAIVEKRVSNPYIWPTTHDTIIDANYDLANQYKFYEFMDPATGKVITAFDNNNQPTDEFKELTGGVPENFRISAIYDPKNHFTVSPESNEKFVKPMSASSKDSEGNLKNFIMSQLPKYTSQEDINTNVIYKNVNLRPGQEAQIHPRVKARELHGKQLDAYLKDKRLTPEELSQATMPIEATIDGKTVIAASPDALAAELVRLGINLKVKE